MGTTACFHEKNSHITPTSVLLFIFLFQTFRDHSYSTPSAINVTKDTPNISSSYYSRIEQTPMSKEKEIYKYFCPLCFCYYKDILKVSCCKNYICYNCSKEWLVSILIIIFRKEFNQYE